MDNNKQKKTLSKDAIVKELKTKIFEHEEAANKYRNALVALDDAMKSDAGNGSVLPEREGDGIFVRIGPGGSTIIGTADGASVVIPKEWDKGMSFKKKTLFAVVKLGCAFVDDITDFIMEKDGLDKSERKKMKRLTQVRMSAYDKEGIVSSRSIRRDVGDRNVNVHEYYLPGL